MSEEKDIKKVNNQKLAKEAKFSQAIYLRTIYLNKFLIGIAGTAVVFMFIAVFIAISMLPLKTVETKYVEFSSSGNNFVTISTASSDIEANDNLISLLLKKYVVDREKINHIDEDSRYEYVYALSTKETANIFKLHYGGEAALIHKKHITREIKLGPITRIAKDIIIIDFETVDNNDHLRKRDGPNYEPNKRQWQATMKYAFSSQKVDSDKKELNPIGIFVTKYQASPRRY